MTALSRRECLTIAASTLPICHQTLRAEGGWQMNNADPMDTVLLKDYQPESTLVAHRTTVFRPHFPVIDAHIHSPANLTAANLRAWVRLMDDLSIEKCFVMTDCVGEEFEQLAHLYLANYRDRFALFCGLENTGYEQPGFSDRVVRMLERCHKAGARGVGELTDKGWGLENGARALTPSSPLHAPRMRRLHLDDGRLERVWSTCAELELPVSIHVADHPSAWQPLGPHQERGRAFSSYSLAGRDVPGYADLIGMRDRIIERHPHTKFIACHLGNQGNDLAALASRMDRFPNLWLDISARDYELGRQPRAAARFLERYRNRVLFGTDYGLSIEMYRQWFRLLETTDEYFPGRAGWRLYALDLPAAVLKPLYAGTAKALLK